MRDQRFNSHLQLTFADLEDLGNRDPVHPEDMAAIIAAGVMRRLHSQEHRVIGSPGIPTLIRDTLEREIAAALRGCDRWIAMRDEALKARA